MSKKPNVRSHPVPLHQHMDIWFYGYDLHRCCQGQSTYFQGPRGHSLMKVRSCFTNTEFRSMAIFLSRVHNHPLIQPSSVGLPLGALFMVERTVGIERIVWWIFDEGIYLPNDATLSRIISVSGPDTTSCITSWLSKSSTRVRIERSCSRNVSEMVNNYGSVCQNY